MWDSIDGRSAILFEVREGDCRERGGDGARGKWRHGSRRSVCRSLRRPSEYESRRAGAAACANSGDALDDQRDTAPGGSRVDDGLRDDVFSIPARVDGRRVAHWRQMGPGPSFHGWAGFAGNFSGVLRRGAPAPGVGAV